MTPTLQTTRPTTRRLANLALVSLMLVSLAAAPVCAMPRCQEEAAAMPAMEHHDCCPATGDDPAPPAKDCGDHCLLQADGTPADLPGAAPGLHLIPVMWFDRVPATPMLSTLDLGTTGDDAGPPRLSSSTPLHILISQYLI